MSEFAALSEDVDLLPTVPTFQFDYHPSHVLFVVDQILTLEYNPLSSIKMGDHTGLSVRVAHVRDFQH